VVSEQKDMSKILKGVKPENCKLFLEHELTRVNLDRPNLNPILE